jgi:hypothetical protein
LVYIAAFAPDKGESVSALIKDPPPSAPVPPILPPQDGYLFLDKAKFAASFAGDVAAETAAFMADSQVPWGVEALTGTIAQPAWKTKPSWYLVTTEDKMIPPEAQRAMSKRAGSTVNEAKGSRCICVAATGCCFHHRESCERSGGKSCLIPGNSETRNRIARNRHIWMDGFKLHDHWTTVAVYDRRRHRNCYNVGITERHSRTDLSN